MKESYGEKIRNYITPVYQLTELIKRHKDGEIADEQLMNTIRLMEKVVDIEGGMNKLLWLSLQKPIEEIYWGDEEMRINELSNKELLEEIKNIKM